MTFDFLKKAKEVFKKYEEDNALKKISKLKREDVRALLESNLEFHRLCIETLADTPAINSLSERSGTADMWNELEKRVTPELARTKIMGKSALVDYRRELKGKAAQNESKSFLSSLLRANILFSDILTNILDHFDKVVDQESVEIYNVRFSYVAALGVIKDSTDVGNFTVYLLTFLIRVMHGDANVIPKYRLKYLEDHASDVGITVNRMLNQTGRYDFVEAITALRNKFQDIPVRGYVDAGGSIDGMLGLAGRIFYYVQAGFGFLISFIPGILDEASDLSRWVYEERKEMRAWMQQHVAMLRMDLEQMDPTSPEYIRLQKVIESYDAEITDYDKKIAKYEEENS